VNPEGHEISSEVLARFAGKQATSAEGQMVLAHLLRGCEICRHHLRLSGWHSKAREMEAFVGNQVPAGPPAGAYDEAFAAAERAAAAALQKKHFPAQQLLAELDRLPPEEQELRVRNLRRYGSPELAVVFIERSHAKRYSDHEGMMRNARLAVAVAEAATPADGGGSAPLNDCRAKAWAQLGNAHRIRSEILEAERAFGRALRLIDAGSGDPGVRAFVLNLLSTLRSFRRDYQGAAALLEEVVKHYRQEHHRAGEAGALISLALVKLYSGRPEVAIPFLQRALRLLTTQEIELLRAAVQNLVYCYLELGEPKLAYGLLADAEPHFLNCTDEAMLLRMNWLRGKIEKDLGLLHAAEVRMSRVRAAFLRQDLALQVAMVSLDLAEVYALQGRVPDLVRTVGETIPIFQSLRVTRDLLASLLRLREIAASQTAAVTLLRQVAAQIRGGLPLAEQASND
jgi:tetratricopeptide (TPR) repeat protein